MLTYAVVMETHRRWRYFNNNQCLCSDWCRTERCTEKCDCGEGGGASWDIRLTKEEPAFLLFALAFYKKLLLFLSSPYTAEILDWSSVQDNKGLWSEASKQDWYFTYYKWGKWQDFIIHVSSCKAGWFITEFYLDIVLCVLSVVIYQIYPSEIETRRCRVFTPFKTLYDVAWCFN